MRVDAKLKRKVLRRVMLPAEGRGETVAKTGISFESIERVGRRLRRSLSRLMRDVCESKQISEKRVVDSLAIDRSVVGRIVRSLREPEDSALLVGLPSPEGIELVVAAAERAGHVSGNGSVSLRRDIGAFERLIDRHPGKRRGLNARLATVGPETQARNERNARRAMYKAAAELLGFRTRQAVAALLVIDGDGDDHYDALHINGKFGLERLRGGEGPISVGSVRPGSTGPKLQFTPLDRDASADDPSSCLIRQCCRGSRHVGRPTRLEFVAREDNFVELQLPADQPRVEDGKIDVTVGQCSKGTLLKKALPTFDAEWFSAVVRMPVAEAFVDVFLPPHVYPDVEPSFSSRLYQVDDPRNQARLNHKLPGQLPMTEAKLESYRGLDAVATDGLGNYHTAIADLAANLDLDPNELRHWRLHIDFPILGSETTIWFPLPE